MASRTPGIDPERQAERVQFAIQGDTRWQAGEGVEVGQMKLAARECFPKGSSEGNRVGTGVQAAGDGSIMGPLAADRADGAAGLDVEDGDHPQRHGRQGSDRDNDGLGPRVSVGRGV